MGWDSSGDLPPQQPRNFRDRYRNDFEDGMGAAYAADQSDNNDAGDMNFGEHAAGFDVDTRYDQRPPSYTPVDQWGQPTQGYPTPPLAPQGWQPVGPNQAYPDPYQQQNYHPQPPSQAPDPYQQQNYYPQQPPLGQAPDPYQQQNYYPQQPPLGQVPDPYQQQNYYPQQPPLGQVPDPYQQQNYYPQQPPLGQAPDPYQQQNYYPQQPPLGQAPDPYQQQNYYPQPPGFAPAPVPPLGQAPDPYQQQNYYPQPPGFAPAPVPPLGQAPDPYQQQNYYPQPPALGQAAYPAQAMGLPTPSSNLLGGQAGVVTQDLPSSVLDFQNRLNSLGSLPSPYQQADTAEGSEGGIDRFFGSSLSGLPCLGNIGTAFIILGVGALLVCLMAFLALGSIDRHLGLGIFYQ